jgi:dTDP-4-amino-4,6-dideoxygalactose transaminase
VKHSTPHAIDFNKPFMTGKELVYIADAVAQRQVSGDGTYSKLCHTFLEQALSVPRALLTTSCTHALEMAALLLDIRPGDEIIVPSFTFVSTINAFMLRGAHPVFSDIRPDTLNMDETGLERLISSRTRAIVPVHYAGVGCEMDAILDIAHRFDIAVVEDNAHGLFGTYRGAQLGTFGCLATQSFHETKNFHCGEGGALLINDPRYIERAEIIREKGTDRSRFFRGQVDKYTWVDIGSSYLPSDILAAFLYAQLEVRDQIQAKRRQIWERYYRDLQPWAEKLGARLPIIPAHCGQPSHLFYVIMPSLAQRQSLIAHLKSRGILAVFHYQPLHLSTMGLKYGGQPGACPVTEQVSDRLLRLPLYYDLTDAEQAFVIEAIHDFTG